MRWVRSALVVALAGVLVGVASPSPATHGLSFLPVDVALANRFFEAEGLDVFQEVLLGTGGLSRKVPFEAVFSNSYLPGAGGR